MMNEAGGYLGNALVKRDGLPQDYTQDQVDEYIKCMNDPIYFAENYVKIITLDSGLQPFKPYPYQRKMFEQFNENRFNLVLACRQSGKSISCVVYILWYAIFNSEKTIAILANKGSTAREMLSRVTLALENLPFFLQPGCKALNKGSLEFSNNSRIIAAATSGSSIRGLSVNLLFLDEFAFVENANTFYTSTYPVISSGKESKVIITSTQNGTGTLFYRLLEGAMQGTNEFQAFRVDWWDVPGRDEEWKRQTIANTSEEQFRQEYGNEAIGSSNTLISANALLGLKNENPKQVYQGTKIYRKVKEGHHYLMMVDVSKGRGQDYSTFNVIDITNGEFEQVATYRDNMISPLIFPDIIIKIAKMYNEAMILIENNDAGQVVCNTVYYEYEYENTFVESSVKRGGIGVTMTKRVKRIGCSNLKDLIELNKLKIHDSETIRELASFEVRGASFQAAQGNHDDLVMNLVLFAWFVSSDAFGNISDINLKDVLFNQKMQEIEDDIPPFGVIDDGTSYGNSAHDRMVEAQKAWKSL
jgi:hypothetical protein